ncbi:hypothetical protein MMPV_005183 [Pyropia vietnamensis]
MAFMTLPPLRWGFAANPDGAPHWRRLRATAHPPRGPPPPARTPGPPRSSPCPQPPASSFSTSRRTFLVTAAAAAAAATAAGRLARPLPVAAATDVEIATAPGAPPPPHGASVSNARPDAIDPSVAEPPITTAAYLDVSIAGAPARRVTIGLYGELLPATVANFLALCTAPAGGGGYAGTDVYRLIPGLTLQAGDVLRNGGKSGAASAAAVEAAAAVAAAAAASITGSGSGRGEGTPAGGSGATNLPPPPSTMGRTFPMEGVRVNHTVLGSVNMVVSRSGEVDSRFFITLRPDSRYLDGKYCAFGRVTGGLDVLADVDAVGGEGVANRPRRRITIVGCGVADVAGGVPGGGAGGGGRKLNGFGGLGGLVV